MRVLAIIILFAIFIGAAYSQSPRSAAAKPRATPAQKGNEKIEFEKAVAVTDPIDRIAALRKFVAAFPRSTHIEDALNSLASTEASLGNDKLTAGETEAALKYIRAAVKDAAKPIPDQLFIDTLSKFPGGLYFRGLRGEGLEIAKALAGKADTNAGQLLSIAAFYIGIEDGAEARRIADNAIKIDPSSAAAYQTLGLAYRLDFKLDESAVAYTKALELDPDSLTARRGLAEMKRAVGKPDEAIALYREILTKDEANLPARTGWILALFDADKRTEAEAEMAKSLEANPGNVILIASAAYWYAAHNEGARAIELAEKAISAEPRFIWSHIALARGLLAEGKPSKAERTLLAARQYGNFPTLEYEIASARNAAGLYRDAADELSKSFSIKDGVIHTNLGGRVPSESRDFTELVGFERRASIFAPTAADNPENAAQLRALLDFKQELSSPEPRPANAAGAAEEFVRGDDKMKVYRQVFAASELLEKKIALPKVLEIAKAAQSSLDAGMDVAEPATAVMASELYERRSIAATRGEYINVPSVPRPTLSAVLRGRIEEITGWASYQTDDATEAVIHLKRAAAVLPVDSAYWRSSIWRLGTALVVSGNDAEALEAYVKGYKSTGPDALRYNTIEAVYKRVKGSTVGLDRLIGPNPSAPPPSETVSQKVEPTPEVKTYIPSVVPAKANSSSTVKNDIPSFVPIRRDPTPEATAQASPVAEADVKEPAKPVEAPVESPSAAPTVVSAPDKSEPDPIPSPTPQPSEQFVPTSVKEISNEPLTESNASPTTTMTPDVPKILEKRSDSALIKEKTSPTPKELFPPVVITIPAVENPKTGNKSGASAEPAPSPTPKVEEPISTENSTEGRSDDTAALNKATSSPTEPTPQPTPEIKPCTLTISEENVVLKHSDGVLAVVVGTEDERSLEELKVVSADSDNVTIRRETIEGLKTRALFVIRSISAKTGVYKVVFEMSCGKKEITVKVQ